MEFQDTVSGGYYIGTFQFEYATRCDISVHLSLIADEDPDTEPYIVASIVATTYGLDNIFINGVYNIQNKHLEFTCAMMIKGTDAPITILTSDKNPVLNLDNLDQAGLQEIRERTDKYLVDYLSN